MKKLIVALFFVIVLADAKGWSIESNLLLEKKVYNLSRMPIDVVIPCIEKDLDTLELCIDGVRKNIDNVRRIIVVSARRLTDSAEWFDEKEYPFSTGILARQIFQNEEAAARFLSNPALIGWIYQQFLKLYAPFVIPEISKNVLIIDADTIFLNPVQFLGPNGEGQYNPGSECHLPYFAHAARLLPGLNRRYPAYSGISNHMLFQKEVMEDLFGIVETYHGSQFWKALCSCVDLEHVYGACLSEYEIYFNFVFTRSDQMQIRPLKWVILSNLAEIEDYRAAGYHYVTCHAYLRK